jgi:ribosomal protein L40E
VQHFVEHLDTTAQRGATTPGRVSLDPNELAELCEQQIGRRDKRFPLERPVQVTAVSLDGMLDVAQRHSGTSREISVRGISVELASGTFHASQPLLLAIHREQIGVQYAGLIVRRVELLGNRTVRLGADFGGPAADVLSTGHLMPQFRQDQMAFVLPQAPQVYDNWADAGVLQKQLLDHVMVCPRCAALPTVRNACRKCGSGRVTTDRLIHHFACAYVGFLGEFETGTDELVCPKCQLRKIAIGADFEYLIGQHRCRSCGWRDSEVELVGHCLRCSNRFEMAQAREQELYRYDVSRLDPLAVTAELA